MFGYIGKHWRGEFSLPHSYWGNGALALLPFNLYLRVVGAMFEVQPPQSPAVYVFAFLLPLLVMLPLLLWSGVGIWRSAGRRIAEGRSGWAWVARIVILFNLVVLLIAIVETAGVNIAVIRAYFAERAAVYSVEEHGDYVVFHGEITDAGANQLEPLLKDSKVKRLVINGSIGGFMQPTFRLAKTIHERKLFVVALAQCESACTVLLAAGEVRAVAPDTPTGFHVSTLMGFDEPNEGSGEMDDYYAKAGMNPALIAKIRTHHGATDLYDPPLRELIDSGFLTDIYVPESELYSPAQEWCAQNPRLCDRTGRQNAHEPLPPEDTKHGK